jgi:aspartate-semialdehyde dehydrogenase
MTTLLQEVDHFGKDTQALCDGTWKEPAGGLYVRPIGWNVLPFAGSEVSEGYTDEELKLVNETRKILEAPEVAIEPTCVRVPVMVSHGIAASAWFERDVSVTEAEELIGAAPGIRPTLGRPGGLSFWVVGDNLRKGAALNAVQIAELVVA